MAHSLKLEVIAEGVETVEQQDFLINNRCAIFQGYFFSKPLPSDEFKDYMVKPKKTSPIIVSDTSL